MRIDAHPKLLVCTEYQSCRRCEFQNGSGQNPPIQYSFKQIISQSSTNLLESSILLQVLVVIKLLHMYSGYSGWRHLVNILYPVLTMGFCGFCVTSSGRSFCGHMPVQITRQLDARVPKHLVGMRGVGPTGREMKGVDVVPFGDRVDVRLL